MDPLLETLLREGLAGLACAGVIGVWIRQGRHEKGCAEHRTKEAATLARIEEHVAGMDKRLEEGAARFEKLEQTDSDLLVAAAKRSRAG